tara:strand:- start:3142 stop:5904 length:2763 start_codon:yes stop_codon:yes gene_type:complete
MFRKIHVHGMEYTVKDDEFLDNTKYNPLIIRKDLSQMDREVFVLRCIGRVFRNLTFVNYGISHGEYVLRNVDDSFSSSMAVGDLGEVGFMSDNMVLRIDKGVSDCKISYFPLIIICCSSDDISGYDSYRLGERYLFIRRLGDGVDEGEGVCESKGGDNGSLVAEFLNVKDGEVRLDNLLHVIYMIKDSGDDFRDVLRKNFRYADRVTILDTGSSDNTLRVVADVIRELGCENIVNVYEESFIDFGASRNRLMDLADVFKVGGEVLPKCAFQMMLDDTYVIEDGDKLRSFLTEVRCDDEAPSLSIYINSLDVMYSSIRLFRPESGIRYKYKIHEIPDCDTSALIPKKFGFINDVHSNYMKSRTVNRKDRDLELLFEEYEKNSDDPRILYYIAETYVVIEDWKNAFDYYNKRVLHKIEGFDEEKYDAMYKAAVMADLHLEYDWNIVMGMYIECYRYNSFRPESIFMLGSHYYNHDVNHDLAYMFFKKAFEIGLPLNTNMNFKIDQYSYYLPKWLIHLCYIKSDPKLGMLACERMLGHREEWDTRVWYGIFTLIDKFKSISKSEGGKKHIIGKKSVVFLSHGGWNKWDGETLYKSGIGGSETFSIKYAEWLGKLGYNVIVFCDCVEEKYYNGVLYKKVDEYMEYLVNNHVDYCIVNRYFEHLYVLREAGVESVYFVYHDIASSEQLLPLFPNLKGVLFISNWAREQFHGVFPGISRDLTRVISYGIDVDKFVMGRIHCNKRWFMYSSFANRGLLELLKMFPRIVERYPDAVLNVFCDLENSWLLEHHSGQVEEIKVLLKEQEKHVINHGWVNQKMLNAFWSMSGVWFYPCTFAETCCLTSYEAAASRTLAISNDLGALKENSGVVIPGDATSDEWKDRALGKLFELMDDESEFDRVVESNFDWVLGEKSFEKVVGDFTKDLIS